MSITVQQRPRRTQAATSAKLASKVSLVKVYLPEALARRTRAHSIILGGRGPRLTIETALNEYFARQGKAVSV